MSTMDHEISVYPGFWDCSCGDHGMTRTGAEAARKAQRHAAKYPENSRVTDTRIINN